MIRRVLCNGVYWIAFVAMGAAGSVQAQDDDYSKVQLKVTKASGNTYLLDGAGGNIAASVGEDGIVIVDDGDHSAVLTQKIQAALKDMGIDKPVRFVINTHYHEDHTGGNAAFREAGATIIAQDNLRKRLRDGGTDGNGGSISREIKPSVKEALPVITFQDELTVHMNGEDIRALHFPAAHTDGDSVVFFRKSNVVHTGDEFVRYGFPFIDVSGGGSVQGLIAAIEKIVALLPPDVKVIPGHGELSNLDDMRAYLKMLKETTAIVQRAIDAKKTMAQMKQEKILEPWAKWNSTTTFMNEDTFLETLYNSLTESHGTS